MTKIQFVYSQAYDQIFEEMYRLKKSELIAQGKHGFQNPYYSPERVKGMINDLKKWRSEREEGILGAIESLYKHQFQQKTMSCYCIGYVHFFLGMSHPLTLCVGSVKDVGEVGVTLIHELLHIINDQHKKQCTDFCTSFEEKYTCNHNTSSHVLIYAVMYRLSECGYITKEELQTHLSHPDDVTITSHISGSLKNDYTTAIALVQDIGYTEIIKLFQKKNV